MLEDELIFLHLDQQAKGSELPRVSETSSNKATHTPSRPHLLPQGHTYSCKASPPSSATLFEPMRVIFF